MGAPLPALSRIAAFQWPHDSGIVSCVLVT